MSQHRYPVESERSRAITGRRRRFAVAFVAVGRSRDAGRLRIQQLEQLGGCSERLGRLRRQSRQGRVDPEDVLKPVLRLDGAERAN